MKKKQTYYTGEPVKKRVVFRGVRNEIRKANMKYREKTAALYHSGKLRAAWHGIKTMAFVN